jgi:hypothetical protein
VRARGLDRSVHGEDALDVVDELAVAAGDAIEEREKPWTVAPRPDGGDFGLIVFLYVRPRLPGREVNDALRRVQLPRIGVPLIDSCREPSIRPGQALDSRDCLAAQSVHDCLRSGLPS